MITRERMLNNSYDSPNGMKCNYNWRIWSTFDQGCEFRKASRISSNVMHNISYIPREMQLKANSKYEKYKLAHPFVRRIISLPVGE